ncbi:SOS response-associated peptidase [Crateriforma conspicua]|uniref:SOS response-associated peptidase n=1 Tax=Crateriforma conspicua TaxID=2527996 RepID=UPI00118C2B32|nr:SOS response-associated peptidase [Crateriforma conspicua]QDV66180.1 Putative SOS response-associated peptidase YedK [Crateriforma conspicua]
MCGRFTLRTPPAAWCQLFLIDPDAVDPDGEPEASSPEPTATASSDSWKPRYNIAPTQIIDAVVQDEAGGPRRHARYRWGLLPPWAKDLSMAARMINARSETVDEKPSFKKAFAQRRCLIPADGYIEWKKQTDGKQPFLAHRHDDAVFAFAGLCERNRQATGDLIESCTILTTRPNAVTGRIHDRMPVVLMPEDYTRWLDPNFRDTDALKELLVAPEESFFELTAVSRRVNNARNNDAACLEPVDADP